MRLLSSDCKVVQLFYESPRQCNLLQPTVIQCWSYNDRQHVLLCTRCIVRDATQDMIRHARIISTHPCTCWRWPLCISPKSTLFGAVNELPERLRGICDAAKLRHQLQGVLQSALLAGRNGQVMTEGLSSSELA